MFTGNHLWFFSSKGATELGSSYPSSFFVCKGNTCSLHYTMQDKEKWNAPILSYHWILSSTFQTIERTMRTESCLMLLRPVNLPWSTRAALWQMPLALDRSITDNFDTFGNNEHLFLLFPQGRENIQDTFPCHQHALRSFQAGFMNSPRG